MKNKLSLKSYYRVLDNSIRKVVMFLFILSATISTAQTNEASSGLTGTEFEKAKQLYLDMMQSDTYKELKQNTVFIANRTKNIELPRLDPSWMGLDDAALGKLYKERVVAWAKANQKKMKFKNAREASNAVIRGVELAQRREVENKELYSLMKRANKAQFSEIIKPEKLL